jgi:16S rRNA processing protein RimM
VTVADRAASIVSRKGDARRVILRLDLTPDRTAAEELRGRDLMVDRSAAPPLDEDEFWAEDLEGCTVADGDRTLGTVVRLLGLPSCEALELEDGTLVPMVRDAIRSIDVKAKRIEVNAGFFGAA